MRPAEPTPEARALLLRLGLLALGAALAALPVYAQIDARGLEYLDVGGRQMERHAAVLAGVAGDPWQFRVLSEVVVEAALRFFGALGVGHAPVVAFVAVRWLQNLAIFAVHRRYLAALGLGGAAGRNGLAPWAGTVLLSCSFACATWGSDLQFNTYTDILAFTLAALWAVRGRFRWLAPLALLGALNRETSLAIGLLPLGMALWPGLSPQRVRLVGVSAAVVAVAAAAHLALRAALPPQTLIVPYGHAPGLDLLVHNLTERQTYAELGKTLTVLPLLALFGFRRLPPTLRAFGVALVPAWVAIHFVMAVAAEARLFLVPQAVVFVPGALFALGAGRWASALDRDGPSEGRGLGGG